MMRVVQRILHKVGRVAKFHAWVLFRDLHLREVSPLSVLIVHRCGRIEVASCCVDASGNKKTVAYPAEIIGEVADRAAGLNHLTSRNDFRTIDLVATKAVLLFAHPIGAANIGNVAPYVAVSNVGNVVCAACVISEAEIRIVAPYQLAASILKKDKVAFGIDRLGIVCEA